MPVSTRILKRFIMSSVMVVVSLLILLAASGQVASAKGVQSASAAFTILPHMPHGSASLSWNMKTTDVTVTITLTGLAPRSTHPAHIHKGDCSVNGAIIFPLSNVVADAGGNATSMTVIHNIPQGIPHSGWYINVHNGPTLGSPDEALVVTCGNIHAPRNVQGGQTSFAALGTSIAPNQHSIAAALLFVRNDSLTVIIAVEGLEPGSMHAAHIHAGSCANQVPGNVLFPLTTIVADQNGNAVVQTVIPNIESIPESGWYINIHRTTNLSTQTGFDPILCGTVRG